MSDGGEPTLAQVAARAGISAATLRRWIEKGLVPQYEGSWTPAAVAQVRVVARLRARGHTLGQIKQAFTQWVWTDPDRADRLARIYNDRFNNLVPRHFDGSHLTLLARDRSGYANLCRLITIAHAGDRRAPRLPWSALAEHAEGLICLTGCRHGLIRERDRRQGLELGR